jgi:hypothetical protein
MGHAFTGEASAEGRFRSAAAPPNLRTGQKGADMLETIAIILIVLWLLGLVTGYTLGNFIYILLVIGIILFLVRLFSRA